MKFVNYLLLIHLISPLSHILYSEETIDRANTVLEVIEVTSTRVEKDINKVPFSISIIEKDEIQLGKQTLTLDESLNKVPGVYVQNRYNYAQDQRISIRGFGSRASFGVRGIKILYDGIPLTLPDGQSQTDSLDLGSADRIEIIRGPVSALYGNSSGGVISIFSETGSQSPFIELKSILGSFDLYKLGLKSGGQLNNFNYFINVSRLDYEGFRDHSETENIQINSNFNYLLSDNFELSLVLNYIDAPEAQDPGALTKEEVNEDRDQAAPANLETDSGESIEQFRIGFKINGYLNDYQEIESLLYLIKRDFEQRLPFGIVSFDRIFIGGGAKYILNRPLFEHKSRILIGADMEYQNDDRLNFSYTDDFKRDDIILDQDEDVLNIGIYSQNEFWVLENLELDLGIRYDYFKFSVDDFLEAGDNTDESGSRTFHEINPKIGLLYSPIESLNLYGNFSTSFQTPTLSELTIKPDGSGGINPDLDPQKTIGFELGIKGYLFGYINYSLALFYADIKDQLIPFEVEEFPGREFFRNAGESEQYGLEFALYYSLFEGLDLSFSYTYLNFEFVDFDTDEGSFDGNDIPGIPNNQIYAGILYKSGMGIYGGADFLYLDGFFVNDANTEKNDSFSVFNLRLGFQRRIFKNFEFNSFLGLNNIFDKKYNSSVRVNAFAGRYFEPAPEFNLYGGISLKYTI